MCWDMLMYSSLIVLVSEYETSYPSFDGKTETIFFVCPNNVPLHWDDDSFHSLIVLSSANEIIVYHLIQIN